MKCDHLLGRMFDSDVYILASDVMEAVAELKAKLDKAIAERDGNQVCIDALKKYIYRLKEEKDQLKDKLESVQASMYCDVVDANMENRRLKRALWIARAEWARSSALSYHLIESHPDKDVSATYKRKANKWEKAKDKCLKKAEEYK